MNCTLKNSLSGMAIMAIFTGVLIVSGCGGGEGVDDSVNINDSNDSSDNEGGDTHASSAKAITAFSFTNPAATGTIDENAKTITATVPDETNETALIATFATTGASVKVENTDQVSGTTPNDFTNPVAYTVTAADSSTTAYMVTVTVSVNDTSVTLAWDAPTMNADGTPCTDLAEYNIHYGTLSGNYTVHSDVGNVTTCTIENLSPATYYFAVTAYDTSTNESGYSSEVSKTIN